MDEQERRRRNAEKARRYRATHKEEVKVKDRAYYLKHREARLAYEADPERRKSKNERMRVWRAKNPELSRLQFRAWNYGLTVEQVKALLAQGCAVCGSTERLHIDHDHRCCPRDSSPRSCGKCVRGALCNGCNSAMGHLGESPERAEALMNYLRRSAI